MMIAADLEARLEQIAEEVEIEDSSDESDSDVSDVYADEDLGNEGGISNWLEEPDDDIIPSEEEKETKPHYEIPDNEYIKSHLELFFALIEVEDLGFFTLSESSQEDLMRSLTVERYLPGQVLFEEGSSSMEMYFVVGSDDLINIGEVEVVKKMDDGTEKVLTRLSKGQYFGQKYFVTKRWVSKHTLLSYDEVIFTNISITYSVKEVQLFVSQKTRFVTLM